MSQKHTNRSAVKVQQGVDHADAITQGASGVEGGKCKDKNEVRGGGHHDVQKDARRDSELVKGGDEIYHHYGEASSLEGAAANKEEKYRASIESKSTNKVSTTDILAGLSLDGSASRVFQQKQAADELPSVSTLRLSSNPYKYDRYFPTFRKPEILGDFSLDSDRKFHHDRRQMMYLYRQDDRETLDLNAGIEDVVRKNEEWNEQLDNLLHWILNNRDTFLANGQESLTSLNSSVVCYRGLLTKFMCTPYEAREGWHIKIIKWRGTMYICEVETEQRRAQRMNATPRQKTMSSWGYKFEQYMTTSDPTHLPNLSTPVIESEEFCCVFRSSLSQFSLVYGAEMDGYESDCVVEPRQLLKPEKFVEMKTSRIIEKDRQHRTFSRYKILSGARLYEATKKSGTKKNSKVFRWNELCSSSERTLCSFFYVRTKKMNDDLRSDETFQPISDQEISFSFSFCIFVIFSLVYTDGWAQSFLVGIDEIVCGWRDDGGFVRGVESFKINQLPKTATQWKPNVCANFLLDLITALNDKISKDDVNVVYNVSWVQRRVLFVEGRRWRRISAKMVHK